MGRAAEEMAALQWQHHPHLCPLQVPSIVGCIHESLEYTSTVSARVSLDALLILLACEYPRELVFSMLIRVPLCDRYQP